MSRPRSSRVLLAISLASTIGCKAASSAEPSASAGAEHPALVTEVFESSTALMPRAVTSFGAAALAGNVYAFGGYFGVPHAYNRDGQSGELWRLEPGGRSFELLATSEPTQGAALVALGDALIRVGGMRANNPAGQPDDIHSLAEVASFSPENNTWTPLASLPSSRSSHAAAVLGQTVYVVGGWKLAGSAQSGEFATSMLALDPQSGWRTLPQPFQKRALAAAPLDGKLVVIGGIDASGKLSREVHVFDPQSGWTRGPDFPADAFGVAASSDGSTLYASARDGQLYALSEPSGAWQPSKRLVFPRFFHQLVQLGPSKLLALGGISGMHAGPRIREVEEVDLTAGAPLRVVAFTTSNPLAGRNRQGVFVHGDALYAFGGNRSLAQHDFKPEDFSADAGRFDLAALAWAPMAKFPVPRQTVQTLIEDDRGLAIGGFGHDQPPQGEAHAHADAYSYDFEEDTWSPDPSVLPTPRTQFGLTSFDGVRWVFGGLDFKPGAQAQFEHPTSVLRAERGKPFVDSGVQLPRPRRAFGGAQLNGRYYLVGGMGDGFATIDKCDVFELASKAWSEIPCPAARISPQLVALDGKLYLAGGSSAGPGGQLTPSTSLEVFDPATNTWTTLLSTLPIEPRHLTMLPYAGGLLLYSAHDEQGRAHFALIKP